MSYTFGPNGRERETTQLNPGTDVHERMLLANGCTLEAHRIEQAGVSPGPWVYVLWVGDTYRVLDSEKAKLVAAFIREAEAP